MRNIVLLALMLITVRLYSQDATKEISLKDSTFIVKSSIEYSHSGKTYTEIYEVVTDSIVYRFGLMFRSSDSTFVRRVPKDSYTREFYDIMKRETEWMIRNQENARKETIDFLNRYRTSPEVWFLFNLYKVLK